MGIFNPGGTYNENDSKVVSGESSTDESGEPDNINKLSDIFGENETEGIKETRRENSESRDSEDESGKGNLEERKDVQRQKDEERIAELQKKLQAQAIVVNLITSINFQIFLVKSRQDKLKKQEGKIVRRTLIQSIYSHLNHFSKSVRA